MHNEDHELVERLTAEARAAGHAEAIMHCRTRPPLAETMADLEICEIGLQAGAHVHIAHSSLARGFALAEIYRGMGTQATSPSFPLSKSINHYKVTIISSSSLRLLATN